MERISKIELQNNISSSIGNVYSFPRLGCKKDSVKIFELPSLIDIQFELEKAKNNALINAVSLGLIKKSQSKTFDLVCNINPYVNKRTKTCMAGTLNQNKLHVTYNIQLDKVVLKNFADRFEEKAVDDYSSFLEIYRNSATGNRIIVKKTSFVWLIRNDPVRLSSDRLERVKAKTIKTKAKKRNHSTIYDSHIKTYLRKPKSLRLFT